MRCSLPFIFLCYSVNAIPSISNYIGLLRNVYLTVSGINLTVINGTCHDCLCTIWMSSPAPSAFNCFQNNNTCAIFTTFIGISSFSFTNSSTSSFYFFELPNYNTTLSTSTVGQSTNNFVSYIR